MSEPLCCICEDALARLLLIDPFRDGIADYGVTCLLDRGHVHLIRWAGPPEVLLEFLRSSHAAVVFGRSLRCFDWALYTF